jgi:hypothetical protein
MADFKSGARTSLVIQRDPPKAMISLSKAATAAEVEAAAAYFSVLKPKSIIQVLETDMAPKTYVTGGHLAAMKAGEKETIGQRIIEVPGDLEQFHQSQRTISFHRLSPDRQHPERSGARGRWRREQDHSVWNLSRARPERARADPWNRGRLTKLYRPPTLRLQAWRSGGDWKRPHEARS